MEEVMEKEKVLEIETQEVFDKVAIRIKYQNFEVLKRGKFKDEEIIVESACAPDYINLNNKLYIQGEVESGDNRVFLIDKEDLKNILEKVNKINEKYGIPKRWRAKENDCYYTIFGENIEKKSLADNKFYNLGNYFKTQEEAQKVKEELDKFWAKVRAGEIKND
jgi:putative uncharacterized protein FNV0866